MANEKKRSFILYHDFFAAIERLNMEQRGALLTAIYENELGLKQTPLDSAVDAVFGIVKLNLDRNRESYMEICRKRREIGKTGGRPSKEEKPNGFEKNQTKPIGYSKSKSNQMKHENENENVNVNEHSLLVERSGESAGLALPGETDEECKKRLEALRKQ